MPHAPRVSYHYVIGTLPVELLETVHTVDRLYDQ